MDEKILIKSEMDAKVKSIFLGIIGVLYFVMAILFLGLCKKKEYGYYYTYEKSGWEAAFSGDGKSLAAFIVGCAFFLIATIVLVIYLANRKCEIVVTEKNVRGKALFGKEVVLPIYMISAYSTSAFMSTISVSTSSGLTKFALIGNYVEIGNVLSKIINDRQDNTSSKIETHTEPAPTTSDMDELIKLKQLLDMGIITQEEFDAKKKQLLGI